MLSTQDAGGKQRTAIVKVCVQVYEVLDNCIDEVQGGYADHVKVLNSSDAYIPDRF